MTNKININKNLEQTTKKMMMEIERVAMVTMVVVNFFKIVVLVTKIAECNLKTLNIKIVLPMAEMETEQDTIGQILEIVDIIAF